MHACGNEKYGSLRLGDTENRNRFTEILQQSFSNENVVCRLDSISSVGFVNHLQWQRGEMYMYRERTTWTTITKQTKKQMNDEGNEVVDIYIVGYDNMVWYWCYRKWNIVWIMKQLLIEDLKQKVLRVSFNWQEQTKRNIENVQMRRAK